MVFFFSTKPAVLLYCLWILFYFNLTLILLTWRIWWAPNNASRWQKGFNSTFKGLMFKWQFCHMETTNPLKFTTNGRKSHRKPQSTSQLVCENRVLFVWVDLHLSLCRHQHPKCVLAIRLLYTPSSFLCTSLFIQPHKQKPNIFKRHFPTPLSRILCFSDCASSYVPGKWYTW